MKKNITCVILSLVVFASGLSILNADEKKDLKKIIIGVWVEIWDHGVTDFKDSNGNMSKKEMFTPSFHAYQGDYQDETYIKFNEDGTGTYFQRGLLKNKNGNYDIVIKVYNKKAKKEEYVIKDELLKRIDFKWEIKGNEIIIDKKIIGYLDDKINKYELKYNKMPTRPLKDNDIDLKDFNLKDEIIIKLIGQFVRITNDKLLNDYKVKYKL